VAIADRGVIGASDYQKAAKALEKEGFSIVFLDLDMPDYDAL